MTIEYTPRGVCSRFFNIQVEDGVIQSVQVIGGCDGNLKGIRQLLRGMKAEDAIARMASAAAARPPPAPIRSPGRCVPLCLRPESRLPAGRGAWPAS